MVKSPELSLETSSGLAETMACMHWRSSMTPIWVDSSMGTVGICRTSGKRARQLVLFSLSNVYKTLTAIVEDGSARVSCLAFYMCVILYLPRIGRVGISPNMLPGDMADSMSGVKAAGESMLDVYPEVEWRKKRQRRSRLWNAGYWRGNR